jgi:hypothetical protein
MDPIDGSVNELAFMRHLMRGIGRRSDLRIWRQNVASIPVRNNAGRILRMFHSGSPKGAADLSGIVLPEGWRLEIELKSARGRLSQEQKCWRDFIEWAGSVYVLVRYDPCLSVEDNLRVAVAIIEKAIRNRRERQS